MKFTQKYHSIIIFILSFVFIVIGNKIYVPAPFDISFTSALLKILMAILGMVVLPIVAITMIFRENIRDYGIIMPKIGKKDLLILVSIVLANIPILYWLSRDNWFQQVYNFKYGLGGAFVLIEIILILIYYLAEELLFRGFLFLGLYNKLGWKSYLATTILFILAHLGKNYKEVIYSGFAGIVFCWTSLKYKSFIPAGIMHFAIAMILNILIYYAFP